MLILEIPIIFAENPFDEINFYKFMNNFSDWKSGNFQN